MTDRTVALVRVSTSRQDLDVQRGAIERWAAAQGVAIDAWYEESATSGVARRRPVLEGLLAEARRGAVGTLVVFKLDRLGRSALQVIQHLHALDEANVRVVSITESLDFGTAAGRLVASVLAHVAEIERENLRERTRAGLVAARERGTALGRPSLRWTADEIDELRALRAAGRTLDAIRAEGTFRVLDARGNPRVPSTRAMRRALSREPVA